MAHWNDGLAARNFAELAASRGGPAERPFLACDDGRSFTFADFWALAGRLALALLTNPVAAFAVDASHRKSGEFLGLPLIDAEALPQKYPPGDFSIFCALSYAKMNTVRENKVLMVKAHGYECASYISSRCTWLTDAPVGENCFILEDNTIPSVERVVKTVLANLG